MNTIVFVVLVATASTGMQIEQICASKVDADAIAERLVGDAENAWATLFEREDVPAWAPAELMAWIDDEEAEAFQTREGKVIWVQPMPLV